MNGFKAKRVSGFMLCYIFDPFKRPAQFARVYNVFIHNVNTKMPEI